MDKDNPQRPNGKDEDEYVARYPEGVWYQFCPWLLKELDDGPDEKRTLKPKPRE